MLILYDIEEFRNIRFNARARSRKRTKSEVGNNVSYILITILLNICLHYRRLIIELDNYAYSYIFRTLLLVPIRNYLKYNLKDVLIKRIQLSLTSLNYIGTPFN